MNAIEKIPHANVVQVPAAANPMAVIQQAIASGASVDSLEKLLAMQERWEANEAKKEFALAMAAAKAEIRPIIKDKVVDFTNKAGIRTNYNHEDLSSIAAQVDPILARHGLSYRFRSAQQDGSVAVTCILAHQRGHTEETTLSAFKDESGNKNPIQAVGSTVTYLQRYTLKLALGLAATKDTDGVAPEEPGKAIDDAQFRYLQDLIDKANADEAKFLKVLGADDLANLTQAQYRTAESLLRKKIKQNEAKEATNGNA